MTNGKLLRQAAQDTGLMRLVEIYDIQDDEWDAAADRYEELKAEVAAKLNGAEVAK